MKAICRKRVSLVFTRHETQHSNPQPYGIVRDSHIKGNDKSVLAYSSMGMTGAALLKTTASIKLLTWLTDSCAGNVQSSFNFSRLRHQKQAAISLCDGAEQREEGGREGEKHRAPFGFY